MGGPGSKSKKPGGTGRLRRKQDRSDKKSKKTKQREPLIEGADRRLEETIVDEKSEREVNRLRNKAANIERIGKEYEDEAIELETDFKTTSSEGQRIFVAETYDLFAPKYIQYMESTGHNNAMRKISYVQGPHLRLPLIDVSAGPGVITEYIIRMFIESALTRQISNELRQDKNPTAFSLLSLDALVDKMERLPTTELPANPNKSPLIVINDFSEGMITLAKRRFENLAERVCAPLKRKVKNVLRNQIQEFYDNNIVFTRYAIEDLPDIFGENCFASVFCSQTMHVTPDKEGVLDAISRILRFGGNLLSIEEFPFNITPTKGYQDIMVRLHATVDPIKGKIDFRNMVEKPTEHPTRDGNVKVRKRLHYVEGSEIRVWVKGGDHPGDEHPMYGFRFEKEGRLTMPKPPKFWKP
jgi:SAM-dependent methyltransferase